MRAHFLLSLLCTLGLAASSAHAVLERFEVRSSSVVQFENASPFGDIRTSISIGTSVVDDDGGSGSPILKRYQLLTGGGSGTTTDLPGFSGFIWTKGKTVLSAGPNQTGTGNTSSSIDWGTLTGFSLTGGQFCHSVPSLVCDLASREDLATVPALLVSTEYNMREWTFHGTGWLGDPFIAFTSQTDFGNSYQFPRGASSPNGTVPALPLIGLTMVGLSVLGVGVAAIRRQRN